MVAFFLLNKKIYFYKKKLKKFDLIIDLQSKFRNKVFYILKNSLMIFFYSKKLLMVFFQKKIKLYSQNHLYNLSLFFEEDVVECDFKVNKLPKEMLLEAKRLLPNSNYVGFSLTQGNEYRKKVGLFLNSQL